MIEGPVAGRMVEKPWGRTSLPPPFRAPAGQRIGEIWFEPPAEVGNLMAKYLFTSEKVSVQAHATDEQTRALGIGAQGKDECWLVVAAEEGASLGIGFDRLLTVDELRSAAADGSIEQMLVWYPVRPGDFFYIPANTVHAIGSGVTLLEVEQRSDLTFRLYDYGRKRTLHVDHGGRIARAEPYRAELHRAVPPTGEIRLVDGPAFSLFRVDGRPSEALVAASSGRPVIALPLTGEVIMGDAVVRAGGCAAASELQELEFAAGAHCLVAWATR